MEDILQAFPDRETFDAYWNESYVPVTYEDIKSIFEEFVDSVDGHIFLSDYEENGCISKEDFKENLSDDAQFAFQDGLTEIFYDKNPELYETAFAIFEENGGTKSEITKIFDDTYQSLYEEFLNQFFDEVIAAAI